MHINITFFSNNKHQTVNRLRNISMKVQTLLHIELYIPMYNMIILISIRLIIQVKHKFTELHYTLHKMTNVGPKIFLLF